MLGFFSGVCHFVALQPPLVLAFLSPSSAMPDVTALLLDDAYNLGRGLGGGEDKRDERVATRSYRNEEAVKRAEHPWTRVKRV